MDKFENVNMVHTNTSDTKAAIAELKPVLLAQFMHDALLIL